MVIVIYSGLRLISLQKCSVLWALCIAPGGVSFCFNLIQFASNIGEHLLYDSLVLDINTNKT